MVQKQDEELPSQVTVLQIVASQEHPHHEATSNQSDPSSSYAYLSLNHVNQRHLAHVQTKKIEIISQRPLLKNHKYFL